MGKVVNKNMFKKILVVLMTLIILGENSFAALISENDGSVFITKPEYDSMRNDFQGRLDEYNRGIDNLVDQAIAAYLAAIQTKTSTNFTGFTEVKSTDEYIYGRRENYGGITKQMWNDVNYTYIGLGFGWTKSGDITRYPLQNYQYGYGGGGSTGYYNEKYIMHCQTLEHLYENEISGYAFNDDGVVTSVYKDDNVKIVANHFGAADMGGGCTYAWIYPISRFTGVERHLDTIYSDITDGGGGRYFRDGGVTTIANVKSNIGSIIPNNSHSPSLYWWSERNHTGLLNETYSENWSFYHTYEKVNKERNIYNYCNIPIYAYKENETEVETFSDPLDNSSFKDPDTNAKYPMDVSTYSYNNQLIINTSDDITTQKGLGIGIQLWNGVGGGENTWASRIGQMIPKFKLKNKTTKNEYKPTVAGYGETDNKFNNLSQFKNGLLPYTNENKVTDYPHYFGGVPIFNRDEKGKVTFKIRFNGTAGRKIRLQVKEFEFPNAKFVDGSAEWGATNPRTGKTYQSELVKVTSNDNTTNDELYIDLDLGTLYTITIKSAKKDTPYFLRFSELDGMSDTGYGGTITYLSDFEIDSKA